MASLLSPSLQLDRLGRELKCSICLGLFKQASSLSCNHTFCTSCILQSMKTSSTCPLCKIPTTRREVRPAPHMDNLVAIYISMGDAAGLDLIASQAAPAGMEPVLQEGTTASRKTDVLSNITNRSKRSGGKSKTQLNSPKYALKGRSLAKKRVQVPSPSSLKGEFGLSTPKTGSAQSSKFSDSLGSTEQKSSNRKRAGSFNAGKSGTSILKRCTVLGEERDVPPITTLLNGKTEMKENDAILESRIDVSRADFPPGNLQFVADENAVNIKLSSSTMKIEAGRRTLEPFFWLKDENSQDSDAVQVTQDTDSFFVAQPKFSDLKDTGDDLSDAAKDDADASDSEDVNCTQPNLRGSDLQVFQDKDSLANSVDCTLNRKGKGKPLEFLQDNAELSDSDSEERVPLSTAKKDQKPTDQKKSKSFIINRKDLQITSEKNFASKGCRVSSKKNTRIKKTQQDEPLEGFKGSEKEVSNSLLPNELRQAETITGTKRKGKGIPYNRLGKRVKCVKAEKAVAIEIDNRSAINKMDYVNENEKKETKGTAKVSFACEKSIADSGTDKTLVGIPKVDTAVPACVFCGVSESSDVTGPMKRYDRKGVPVPPQNMTTDAKIILVHSHCAEWAPNVYFVGDVAKNLLTEYVRGQKIKCSSCGKKGAALGCCLKRCKRSYHYPCARTEACKWNEDEFIMYCSEHTSKKFPVKRKRVNADHSSPSMEKPCATADLLGKTGKSTNSRTQEWLCGTANKWVLCGSALDNEGKEQLAAFAKLTGATVAKTWSNNVTHVIAGTDQNGAARRTLKFLLAILQGKWILKLDWLKACIEAGKPVNEAIFEIQSDIHGVLQGPKHGRLRASSNDSKLFEEFQFYFMADFLPAYKNDLQTLVTAGGGVVLHRKPVVSCSDGMQKRTIIVYNNEAPANMSHSAASEVMKRRQAEGKELGMQVNACVLPHDWILESIASSKLYSMP